MIKLNFGRDIQGMNAYAPQMSDYKLSATIATSTEQHFTVSSASENWIAVFSYLDGSIWVANNATAAGPAGATFASTTSQLRPAQLLVKAGDVLSFFNNSSSSQDVGVAFYAIP